MATTTLVIEKKKYRLIPNEEYLQLMEDIRDLTIIASRKDEKTIDAKKLFETIRKSRK